MSRTVYGNEDIPGLLASISYDLARIADALEAVTKATAKKDQLIAAALGRDPEIAAALKEARS